MRRADRQRSHNEEQASARAEMPCSHCGLPEEISHGPSFTLVFNYARGCQSNPNSKDSLICGEDAHLRCTLHAKTHQVLCLGLSFLHCASTRHGTVHPSGRNLGFSAPGSPPDIWQKCRLTLASCVISLCCQAAVNKHGDSFKRALSVPERMSSTGWLQYPPGETLPITKNLLFSFVDMAQMGNLNALLLLVGCLGV